MSKARFEVNEQCIGCRACVSVAEANFEINDANRAFLKKQPENKDEVEQCREAMKACPVDAIFVSDTVPGDEIKPVLARSNIKTTLDRYPELKFMLVELSPIFNMG